MNKTMREKIRIIFEKYPSIKLVYLFGSQARGNAGPLSDFDFAFYTTEKDSKKIFKLRLSLMTEISLLLKKDNIDVVALNSIDNSELKYNIIREGKVILEKEPYKVLIEPKILNEYFDFRQSLALASVS